jgi:PIN domain nuclease of toxin-antitoxin system
VNDKVLDASVVLAYLHKESGWQAVEKTLQENKCLISTVDYTEVVSKLAKKGLPAEAIQNALDAVNLNLIDFDSALSMTAGLLRPLTKLAGLSLGDRACLALAKHRNAPALTTDHAWKNLNIDIAITVIRRLAYQNSK